MTGRLHGVVAMDGPSGTGKSTVSRRLAAATGAAYLDTGAMYRAVTLAVLRAGLAGDEPEAEQVAVDAVDDAALGHRPGRADDPAGRRRRRGRDPGAGGDPGGERGLGAARGAHRAGGPAAGADRGRDAGRAGGSWSRAATSAASWCRTRRSRCTSPRPSEIRAARRGAQDRKAGRDGDFDTVLADVRRRDQLDSTRKTSPLHVAADAAGHRHRRAVAWTPCWPSCCDW